MRWLQTEYLLKGIYLGLLGFIALRAQSIQAALAVTLYTFLGLVLFLGIAAVPKLRQGYQVKGRLLSFVLFLLLESSLMVYAGALLGTAVGAIQVASEVQAQVEPQPGGEGMDQDEANRQARDQARKDLLWAVVGGAVIGAIFGALHQVRDRRWRLGLSLALAAGLVVGPLYLFGMVPGHAPEQAVRFSDARVFGTVLLLGIPVFYLLTFAGREEESEIEIGAACAALGLGSAILLKDLPTIQSAAFIVPVFLYFYYTMKVMPGLRVFKHALRGLSHARIGRYRQALLSFRRALQLDPNNQLARDGFWGVHKALDFNQLANDPDTLALVDFDLCLDRAGTLLMQPPTPEKLAEAHRLLDLVLSQRPALRPTIDYWRSVAHTHARQYDQAAAELERVLDRECYGRDNPSRRATLLRAWQLALLGHEELRRRIGAGQLAQPGRRMEAIAAVERQLAQAPDDPPAWAMKRLLYQDLTEREYEEGAAEGIREGEFDYGYVQQLGLALINDPGRWQRGGEYLRMAAHGLPAFGPSIFVQIAQAHQRADNPEGAWHNYELAKRAGRSVGPKNLGDADRQAYFATVKMLGEAAHARGDYDAAIENYQLFAESERSGMETYRTLAALYEAKGDPLLALRATEQGLIYNGKDKDLLERKDKYYYSVLPEDLKARMEGVRSWFDVAYCVRKARQLLDPKITDLDCLDWAQHLVELALVAQPDSVTAKVLKARALLRRGEKEQAVSLLESVRTPKPEKFAGAEDEEAWFVANKLLGELYLYDLGRPDLSVPCFNDFRKSAKSGADTLFKLGQAYEQLGDLPRAAKCYEQVTAYEGHPLAPDAREALYRMQTQ